MLVAIRQPILVEPQSSVQMGFMIALSAVMALR